MDERALRERQVSIPIREGEGFLEGDEVAAAAGEEDVGGERFDVFKFLEGERGAGKPDGEAAFDGGGSLGDGGVGEFRVVVEVELEKFGALGRKAEGFGKLASERVAADVEHFSTANVARIDDSDAGFAGADINQNGGEIDVNIVAEAGA